jgi:hypothetical protein
MAENDPPVQWTGMAMKWIGWDGSEWSLTHAGSGTIMLPGVRGLNMPPVIHHRAAHASLSGARWRGHTVDVRQVFWPLQVYSDAGSVEWVERDRAFWKTLDPGKPGQWVVTAPDGAARTLNLRFLNDSEFTMDRDIMRAGWANYGITLSAEQPFWEGETIERQWVSGTSVPFFPVAGAPAFGISPSNVISTATLENPGDVPAYVVWRVEGPITDAIVGVNGRNITIPFAVSAGQVLEIDTRPTAQTAMLGPTAGPLTTDKTMNLGTIDFAPLPPGEISQLSLTVNGAGTVSASFKPYYYRAW